ncbi:MAG TPA: methyltransferase domain-containing protein, partial [Mycobacteriales bacterium]
MSRYLGGAVQWDPQQYDRYADERGRPFSDLVRRIGATDPASVLDAGCGSGELTVTLRLRWPDARVRGVDSSAEMIAARRSDSGVELTVGRAQDISARGVDVFVSNAALQWVPEHPDLLPRWAEELEPDGWLAFQVPANFDAPSHHLMREVAAAPRWRGRLDGVLRAAPVESPAAYLDLLAGLGMSVDAWQTDYLHVLPGDDAVLAWVRGTGLRPVLAVLDDVATAEFEAEYGELLRRAYPQQPYGTV